MTMVSEKNIQNAIIIYLEYKKIFHYRQNTGALATPTGGFIRYGTTGAPDIVCVIAGKYVGLEVKKPGGKLSAGQKLFSEKLKNAGGDYHVVCSIDDAIEVIKSYENLHKVIDHECS